METADTIQEKKHNMKKRICSRRNAANCSVIQIVIVVLIVIVIIINVFDIETSLREPEHHESASSNSDISEVQKPQPACQPKKNFVFIKTHRTGSQTFVNMMYRAALKYNLLVVPFQGGCFTRYGLDHEKCPLVFLSDVYYSRLGIPNVYVGDHLLDKKSLPLSLMPSDTVYLTSMRSPQEQVKSHFAVVYNEVNSSGSEVSNIMVKNSGWHYWTQLCNRTTAYQEAMKLCNEKSKGNAKLVKKCLADACSKVVEENFQVVAITDRMDESLVLLKRKMCWTHKDIVYVPLKQRDKKQKALNKQLEKYEENTIDEELFNRSSKRLMEEINRDSADFNRETKHFKKIQYVVEQFCGIIFSSLHANLSNVYEVVVADKEVPIPQAKWGSGFDLDPMLCVMIRLNPKIFNNVFIVKMFPEICKSVPRDLSVSLFEFKVGFDMGYNATIVRMHPDYCSPLQTRYQIPIRILEHPEAYDSWPK